MMASELPARLLTIMLSHRLSALALLLVAASALPQGRHAWRVNASAQSVTAVQALAVDDLGNSYVAGTTGLGNGVVVKLSPSGSIVWTATINGMEVVDAARTSAEEILVAGTMNARPALVKLSPAGTLVWTNPGNLFQADCARLAAAFDGSSAVVHTHVVGGAARWGYHWVSDSGEDGELVVDPTISSISVARVGPTGTLFIGGRRTNQEGFVRRAGSTSSRLYTFPNGNISAVLFDGGVTYVAGSQGANGLVARLADSGTIWSALAPNALHLDAVCDPSGNVLACGMDTLHDAALLTRYRDNGSLDLQSSFTGLQVNQRVLTDEYGNAYVLAMAGNVSQIFLRRLSARDFTSVWAGDSVGGSYLATYGRANPACFARTPSGNLFVAGKGAGSEMFVDKFEDRTLVNFVVEPSEIQASLKAQATLTLSGPAAGDTVVTLSSSSPNAIAPATFTIPNGQTSATFSILTTDPPMQETTATLKATLMGNTRQDTLAVRRANRATFIDSSLPVTVQRGRSYLVRMRFKNTGALPWSAANGYALQSQQPPNNTIWAVNRMKLANGPIAPGAIGIFTATVTAPPAAGHYPFRWRPIASPAQGPFGSTGGSLSVTVQ